MRTGRERMSFQWKTAVSVVNVFYALIFTAVPSGKAIFMSQASINCLSCPKTAAQRQTVCSHADSSTTFKYRYLSQCCIFCLFVCLYVCFEGHYHNKEFTPYLIAHFHIKVKIKRDSCASLTENMVVFLCLSFFQN